MLTLSSLKRFIVFLSVMAGAISARAQALCSGTVLTVSASTASISGTSDTYTVPAGGPYKIRITAKGGKGGNGSGGAGATMTGEFIVSSGQVLQVIAGAPGGDGGSTYAGGGGGGSGVLMQGNNLLILAGGGGGGGSTAGGGATSTNNGDVGGNGSIDGGGGGGGFTGGGGGGSGGAFGSGGDGGSGGFGANGGQGGDDAGSGGGGFGAGGGGGGTPDFTTITSEPLALTGIPAGTYTVRTRLTYNSNIFYDYTISPITVPFPAQILSLSVVESGCPVRLVGQATGIGFTFTDGRGYVFSHIYRTLGTYPIYAEGITKPGAYTLTATNSNICGSSMPVAQTITVTRSCP